MSRRGRPRHTYEVQFSRPDGPDAPGYEPWTDDKAVKASGDFEWAAHAMQFSFSYLRLLLSARRGEPIETVIIFRGSRVKATMRRVG